MMLFFVFLVGIILAVFQDFKRREIDDWLNLFLFLSGILFLLYGYLFFGSSFSIVSFGFFCFGMFLISILFYYGRFFSGGDAKLLFALGPYFYSFSLVDSFISLGYFLVLLFFSGAAYGLSYIIFLTVRDFKSVQGSVSKNEYLFKSKIAFVLFLAFVFMGFFNVRFIFLAPLVYVFLLLVILGKSLESVSLTRSVSSSVLVEGDWIVGDISFRGRKIKSSWEGLNREDIALLKNYRGKIKVKDGIQFAPAFLIAFVLYFFLDNLLAILF